jgi:Cu/Ag efflux protein CusF
MKQKSTLIVAALAAALSLPAVAQQKATAEGAAMVASAPGKATIAQAVKVTATVEAIDLKTREVTLKGPKGNVSVLTAGPDVRNLEQVKVGDVAAVGYLEALTLTLKKDGKELPAAATKSQDSARAASGQRPAGVVAQQVEVTADVTALDAKTQTVTLKGPKQVVELKVPDAGQFKAIKVGDKIQAVYTQALALSVEPVASAPKK